MPRKCHLCASLEHSAGNCPRLQLIFPDTTSAIPSQQSTTITYDQMIIKNRHGLQFILPYHHIFSVPVKGRWDGKTLADAFREEFTHYSTEYFEPACREGRLKLVWDLPHLRKAEKVEKHRTDQQKLQLRRRRQRTEEVKDDDDDDDEVDNDEAAAKKSECDNDGIDEQQQVQNEATLDPPSLPSTVLRVGMIILHRVHRHELPVLQNVCPIEIVDFVPVPFASSLSAAGSSSASPMHSHVRGILVVNKPPSIPVHSCGRYFFNTVQHMLRCGYFKFHHQDAKGGETGNTADDALRIAKNVLSSSAVGFGAMDNDVENVVQKARLLLQEHVFGDPQDAETSGLHSCHRLDRGTSGVLLFATCPEVAKIVFNALCEKSDEGAVVDEPAELVDSCPVKKMDSTKMSKIYLARVRGKVVPPSDASFAESETNVESCPSPSSSSSSSRFFCVQRSLYCSSTHTGHFRCLTAEQEARAKAFRKQEADSKQRLEEQDRARKKEIQQQHNSARNNHKINNEDSIQKLKQEKRERQAQICKGRNARGAFTQHVQQQQHQQEHKPNQDSSDTTTTTSNEQHNSEGDDETHGISVKTDADASEFDAADEIAVRYSKWATTWFRVLSYDEMTNESVVECHPVTGRTHQLRVHLAIAMNTPILGDDLYGVDETSSPEAEGNDESPPLFLSKRQLTRLWGPSTSTQNDSSSSTKNNNNDDDDGDDGCADDETFDSAPLVPGKDYQIDPTCPDCTQKKQKDDHFVTGGSPFLALHAWKYRIRLSNSTIDQIVEAPRPKWSLH